MVIETAILCLALNIYHEARAEPEAGQYMVAFVTMNRAERRRGRVCATVFEPSQFSWTIDMVEKVGGGYRLLPNGVPREGQAWSKAVLIASTVIKDKVEDISYGATHYHATYVNPVWAKNLQFVTRLGGHIFYRPNVMAWR